MGVTGTSGGGPVFQPEDEVCEAPPPEEPQVCEAPPPGVNLPPDEQVCRIEDPAGHAARLEEQMRTHHDQAIDGARTPADFNRLVGADLRQDGNNFADPAAASRLANRYANDQAFREHVDRDGSKDTKRLLAQATLVDRELRSDRMPMQIQRLTAGRNAPTLDEVLERAPEGAMNSVVRGMTLQQCPNMAELLAKGTRPETQARAAQQLLANPDVSPRDRRVGLQNLMTNQTPAALNHLIQNAQDNRTVYRSGGGSESVNESQAYAAAIAGSVKLQESVGRHMTPANQQKVADQVMALPLPRSSTGRALSIMMHPANMSPQNRNAMIDHFQDTRRMPAFLETQVYMPFDQSLLPGLTPANAAAVSRGFDELAAEARTNPEVANPNRLGRTVSEEEQRSYERSRGTSHTDERSSTHTVGAEVTAGGKVGIPLVAEGEVSVTGSYSYANAHGSSDTREESSTRGYSQTFGTSVDQSARQTYDRDVRNWAQGNSFRRAATDIDGWAQNRPGQFRTQYRAERGEIHRDVQ